MSNDLTLPASSANRVAMSRDQLRAALSGVVTESKTVNSEYLTFTGREGRYQVSTGAGSEPADFPTGSKVLLNVFASRKGYTCWKDGKAIDREDFALLGPPLPPESSLTDHGPYSTKPDSREGWKMYYTAFLKDLESGKQYQLSLNSPSATRAFGALIAEIVEQSALHDLNAETPVITLGVESFKSNGYKNYKPSFVVADWLANPSTEAAAAVTAEAPAAEEAVEASQEKKAMPASRKK